MFHLDRVYTIEYCSLKRYLATASTEEEVMQGYPIALFAHLLSLSLAIVGTSLATYAALRLRAASNVDEATQWLAFTGKVVRVFPIATIGLLATGAYLTWRISGWSEPWILASLIALAAITVLGVGIEGRRGRALRRELQAFGWSPRARHLLCDPLSWSAKLTTLTLLVAVMFIMTDKPSAETCAAVLILAAIAGIFGAVPLWIRPVAEDTVANLPASR